ncbi:MAG: hypothetical protein J7K34_02775 [Flavobacteriaceae bacterium]|nr:hypothetical protein [Flavobacteriaceae bacterium]
MEHKDWDFYQVESKKPLIFTGLAFGEKGKNISILLLANYSSTSISVIKPNEFSSAKVTIINDKNIYQLIKNPMKFNELKKENMAKKINIPPFGFVILL